MSLTDQIAGGLAKRSSRRTFFRVLGGSALGSGLALTGTGVALASTEAACYGCGGGTTCHSPAPPCRTCGDGCYGGGCGPGCSESGGWTICSSGGCKVRCSECCCGGSGCYCFVQLPYRCRTGVVCPC